MRTIPEEQADVRRYFAKVRRLEDLRQLVQPRIDRRFWYRGASRRNAAKAAGLKIK